MITDRAIWEKELSRWMEEKKIAGAAVALTDRDRILWEQGFGVTSAEKPWDKVSPQTLFRIASNTKFTVGLCAMILWERGLLDFDAPVREYLPWFTVAGITEAPENAGNVKKTAGPDAAERITVRKLLNHTAGLPAEYTPDGPREESRLEEVLMEIVPPLTLIADPDENHYLYSNYGVRLVACLMEKITGKKFSALCRELVLAPLGMEKTTFDLFRAATYELALPHYKNEAGEPAVEHQFHENATRYAAGGLFSNVHEMTALARVKLNGGAPLLSAEAWRQMSTPYVRMTEIKQEGYYGITLMKRCYNGTWLYGHTGSHPPFYSCIWTEPEKGFGVCFTINTEGGPAFTNYIVPELFTSGGSL